MWGDRANCRLIEYKIGENVDTLVAEHDGYKPCIHKRSFEFDKIGKILSIEDEVYEQVNYVVTFMLGRHIVPKQKTDNSIELQTSTAAIEFYVDGAQRIVIEDAEVSPEYGVKVPTKAIRVYSCSKRLKSIIKINL